MLFWRAASRIAGAAVYVAMTGGVARWFPQHERGLSQTALGDVGGALTLLGGKGKVAIITSVGATNLQRRLDGVREVLGAWISVGGWPVFTRNALAPVPPQTKVISFDTVPPAPGLLKAGKVQVLLGQKYFGWGSESVRILADIKACRMPASPIVDSVVDVVTAANVDEYLAKWKAIEK